MGTDCEAPVFVNREPKGVGFSFLVAEPPNHMI